MRQRSEAQAGKKLDMVGLIEAPVVSLAIDERIKANGLDTGSGQAQLDDAILGTWQQISRCERGRCRSEGW